MGQGRNALDKRVRVIESSEKEEVVSEEREDEQERKRTSRIRS